MATLRSLGVIRKYRPVANGESSVLMTSSDMTDLTLFVSTTGTATLEFTFDGADFITADLATWFPVTLTDGYFIAAGFTPTAFRCVSDNDDTSFVACWKS